MSAYFFIPVRVYYLRSGILWSENYLWFFLRRKGTGKRLKRRKNSKKTLKVVEENKRRKRLKIVGAK